MYFALTVLGFMLMIVTDFLTRERRNNHEEVRRLFAAVSLHLDGISSGDPKSPPAENKTEDVMPVQNPPAVEPETLPRAEHDLALWFEVDNQSVTEPSKESPGQRFLRALLRSLSAWTT